MRVRAGIRHTEAVPELLKAIRFGNPLLRQAARYLDLSEITSTATRNLISNMRYTLEYKKYGVGLAAPQIGEGVALSVISVKPTPVRPELKPFELILINPEIIATFGRRTGMWEGCISCGTGKDTLFAKVPRYKRVRARWLDEAAHQHEEVLDSFTAHIFQHEVDHINGILFVDRVKDTTSYMMADEYRRRIIGNGHRGSAGTV